MEYNNIGIIGLSVMGKNLALNMADHGYRVAGYNRTYAVTSKLMEESPHPMFTGYQDLTAFVESLTQPRKIMLMVKAGKAIDALIESLKPLLSEGDMILDGGNSFFEDTMRRQAELSKSGIHFFGVGISGGEKGARNGPSIMPGGDIKSYQEVQSIFEDIAAKADDGRACCTYIGENGAGHFVKMVHNGIEYADMQLISEAYVILKQLGNFTNQEMAKIFQSWDEGVLSSYLIRITAKILETEDPFEKGELIDKIRDVSKQKGTGLWTSVEALKQGIDVSMISAAYLARVNSGNQNRSAIQQAYEASSRNVTQDRDELITQVKQALYSAKIIAYAQGFALLQEASDTYHWDLPLGKIASIFRAGCIIQAVFLDDIEKAYEKDDQLSHLLLDEFFANALKTNIGSLRAVVMMAIQSGIAVPSMSSAIAYFDALHSHLLGANLIQAMRDFFGAHTFERIDQEGVFHHEWE